MSEPQGFYKLPRELRDQIYEDYFALDDGYHYSYKTNRLLSAEGESIDLSLRSTSRQIMNETRGLALKVNTIHFSTVYDEDLRERAGAFGAALAAFDSLKIEYLRKAGSSGFINNDACSYVARDFPQFLDAIQALRSSNDNIYLAYGEQGRHRETLSISRDFVASTVNFIDNQPILSNKLKEPLFWRAREGEPDSAAVIAQNHMPWDMPSLQDVVTMNQVLLPRYSVRHFRWDADRYWEHEKNRFSAVTMAIYFLNAISPNARLDIRRIVLNEERPAVAWSKCHGRGLIPFYQHNPALRIERRVSLWRAILPGLSAKPKELVLQFPNILRVARDDRVQADKISRGFWETGVAGWIKETLALPSLGMPTASFRMTMTASPPQRSQPRCSISFSAILHGRPPSRNVSLIRAYGQTHRLGWRPGLAMHT
jgi:hypothetical protein